MSLGKSAPRHARRFASRFWWCVGLCLLLMTGCQAFGTGRLVYDREGVQVGVEPDPSIRRSSPPAFNAHPAALSPQDLLPLLASFRVSGWSGTIVGLFDSPRAIRLFDDADLRLVVTPIAEALRQATPEQRVFFRLPNPASPYGDATAGALFLRGPHVHLVLTDHKAFLRADTAGGEERDVRDTKGMALVASAPHEAVRLPPLEEPAWAPFETVHLSVNRQPATVQSQVKPSSPSTEPAQELRTQIRELTQSNLDLRDRLSQQSRELQDLKEELARIRKGLKGQAPRPAPSKKSTTR
ncbi:MAG: hypothetical protein L6Q34_12005 [Nitrospira sp.]|nr:hypothetical protein [Nitrospira sp.]QOJ33588.1 MAG: hypothetical protein HRU82_00875 [Nitrospira sp.]